MASVQENYLFLAKSKTLRGREGERELTYWCMPAALTLYLFLFFSSNIPLSYLFFSILVFYSRFSSSYIMVLVSSPVHGKGLFL